MKKTLFSYTILLFFIFTIIIQPGCKKDEPVSTTNTNTVYPIEGLWTGTYTVGDGNPVPAGTNFYFSLSIYPDGALSYKSKIYHNGSSEYIAFANGTWQLNGSSFSFSVQTLNYPDGGPQHTQTGTATYNITTSTLANGTLEDALGMPVTWTMTRVN